jgi:RNA polymerase sigma factor (sigma-70 family)
MMTDAPAADTRPAPTPEFSDAAIASMDDVYRFARSLTRDPSDAEDVVQDTYLRAFRSWHTFQPGTDIRRWLFTIARNVFLRSRERGQREVTLDEDQSAVVDATQAHETWVRGADPSRPHRSALRALALPQTSARWWSRRRRGPPVRGRGRRPRHPRRHGALAALPRTQAPAGQSRPARP